MTTNGQKSSKTLNVLLWTAQILLTATMIWAALMKLLQPVDKLAEMWPWTAENPGLVRTTGIADLLGGIGLILPAFLKRPGWIAYTAYGIVLLMVAAGMFHISRGEASQIGVNVFVAMLAGFIAWGRK